MIIWSDEALEDDHQNISYLLEKWPIKVTKRFIEEVDDILDLIISYPTLFP